MTNLQPISDPRPGQLLLCGSCVRMTPVEECMADMDGPAFAAYYCRACQPFAAAHSLRIARELADAEAYRSRAPMEA